MSIEQILARLAEINSAIDTATGDDLAALESEARTLMDQLTAARDESRRRQTLRESIAAGDGTVVEQRGARQETLAPDSPEYRSAWLRGLQGRSLTTQERAAITGAAIPTTTMNRIIGVLERNPLLAAIDITHIPGPVSYPKETSSSDASWVDMAAASTDGTDSFGTVDLGTYKIIKTLEIGADVAAMSVDAFEDWLVARLANKLETAVEASVLVGTGKGQALGLLTANTVSTTGTWTKAGMTYKDLLGILAKLPTAYAQNATLVMNRALFYTEVLGLTDTTGRPVAVQDVQSPAKYSVLGYPVIVDDNCTADRLVFGDLKMYTVNFGQDPVVEPNTSVGFRSGTTVYRVMALADGKPLDENAFVVYSRATA